jgi:hypothetical protein
MTTGLLARFTAATDATFQQRTTEAVVEAAVAIYNEGPGVAGHQARAQLAQQVLRGSTYSQQFALALVTQGLDTTSTDAAISTGVASVWNALAGA